MFTYIMIQSKLPKRWHLSWNLKEMKETTMVWGGEAREGKYKTYEAQNEEQSRDSSRRNTE